MWLLTAVGPVHGQPNFTFALEQKKTYTVGRDKASDIRFDSRYVKPTQGRVVVGDWDPFNPTVPPSLQWQNEPNKKGVLPAFRTLLPGGEDFNVENAVKEDFKVVEVPEGTEGWAMHEEKGLGIELAEDCWFTVRWSPYSICHERLDKDEPPETAEKIQRYCIHHTTVIDSTTTDLPAVVISPEYKSAPTLNYAVCFAVRIVSPAFLHALLIRLDACWKQAADHQDSFALPDAGSKEYEPTLDPKLPNVRKEVEAWAPDERTAGLFKGWRILGLKGKGPPAEKRFLIAMGATWSEIDVLSTPLADSNDFAARMAPWLKDFDDQNIDRKTGLVVFFARVSAEIGKTMSFRSVVGTPCQAAGVILASGNITWGAVRYKSVQTYLDVVSEQQHGQAGQDTALTAVTNDHARPAVPATVPPTQATAMPSSSAPAPPTQTAAIPSTYPDETEAPGAEAAKAPPLASKRKSPEASAVPETTEQSTRKPLRKRAARKVDLFADDIEPMAEAADVVMETARPAASQSVQARSIDDRPDQVPETQTNSLGPRSRLKRRAGIADTQTKSSFDLDFDEQYETDRKKEQANAEYRELYESTRTSSRQPPNKRQRLLTPVESVGSNTPDVELRDDGLDAMDIEAPEEVEEVEDPMEDLKRRTRQAREQADAPPKINKKTSMAPPPVPKRQTRSPSEDPEPIEKKKKDPESKKMDTDQVFLQAQQKQRKVKTAEAELDREFTKDFNRLKLSKAKAAEKAPWDRYQIPDYNLVDDFGDDMRGNFIEIVRKDLFRKDLGKDKGREMGIEDGRPNFKKFKKKNIVRREPMKLALVGQGLNDAEMGEPYWAADLGRPSKSQGMTQSGMAHNDDDDVPLLPRAKKRLIGDDDDDLSDDEDPSSTSRRRVGRTNVTQPTQPTSTARATRKTRASSVASNVSDVSEAPAGHPRSSAASTSSRTESAVSSKPAARGKKKMESIVIEDSEEEVAFDLAKTGSASTSTRTARPTGTRGTRGTASTLQASGVSGVPGTSAMDPPSSSLGRSGTATGRRKLLVDSDDEDDVQGSKVLQKKRRLG